MISLANFINGEKVAPTKGEYLDNYCPATGEISSQIPDSCSLDVNSAVSAASKAFPIWSAMSPLERAKRLNHLADLIDQNSEEFAKAESLDQGKPLWLAREVDIPRASKNLRHFASSIIGKSSVAFTDEPHILNYVNRHPVGPCALISPWNLPLYILTWKLAPCLATGNTAICKPSELTPMTAYLLSDLIAQVDFPPGTVNILHGLGHRVGQALVEHPGVPAISFTGGTATGGQIAKTVSQQFKKLSLELGGKNPNIIFADADYETALKKSIRSSFLNQGEICLCGSRIFVEQSIYDRFVSDFVKEANQLKVGHPLDPQNFLGALVSKDHLAKVQGYVELGRQEGGEVLTETKVENLGPEAAKGYYMRPTVIAGLTAKCRVQNEEIFGPVVTVSPFKTEEEVLNLANGVRYGLSASLWTQDVKRAHRVASRIQAGTVWVNTWMKRDLRVPFGGMKDSGVGREGGDSSLQFFTEPQNVCIDFG